MTRTRLESLIGGGEDRSAWADMAEADRIGAVRAFGSVPDECGADIIPAIARGPVRAVHLQALYPASGGGFEAKPAGFQGRATLVVADVFDRMQAQAAKKKSRIALTVGQIEQGRLYARLVERHEAGAVRCSSLEGRSGGDGTGGGFTDARLESARRIDLMRARIGDGMAMDVQRVRKARPGQLQRVRITARQLVDQVCIGDQEISKVLRRYGWAADGATIRRCCEALGAILDRMAGPAPRSGIRAMRTDLPPDIWNRV